VPSALSAFRFFAHFDYGLLREGPQRLQFDKWQHDHWHAIILNPFTASMSPIPVEEARLIAGDELYERSTTQERPGGIVVPIDWPAKPIPDN
jgi:hypothetical protein